MKAIVIPLKIPSAANLREHPMARYRRAKSQRAAAIVVPVHPLPCIVRLIRIAPRPLDSDNLQSAFKSLRDGIADRLGVKDNDPRVRWEYDQQRGAPKLYAVRVEVRAA